MQILIWRSKSYQDAKCQNFDVTPNVAGRWGQSQQDRMSNLKRRQNKNGSINSKKMFIFRS